jgi:hypothetical protein
VAGSTLPYAFTEQGVAMLSSVLRSETADAGQCGDHAGLCPATARIPVERRDHEDSSEDLSNRVDSHDQVIGDIVESIRQLAALPPRERSRPIGFTADLDSDSS